MPANEKHKEYTGNIAKWETARDCAKGSSDVKKKTTKYLPKPNATDVSHENNERYKAYVNRANYVNFTGSTLDGMLGMVFRDKTEIDLHDALDYMEDNSNGGGLSLEQSSKKIIIELLLAGRAGLLVDYPESQYETPTKADVKANNLRANVLIYKAESCINWRIEKVGAIERLTLVVLSEDVEVGSSDEFTVNCEEWYRVLRLEEGAYTQEMLNHEFVSMGKITPTQSDGSTFDEIPFIFAGAKNNDPEVDDAPLYDIAEINLSHYRNSADFEESCFMVGQPTPVLSGLTQHWVDEVMKTGVQFGSRTSILLPEGGSATLLQAVPNQLPDRGMELKEEQMVKIGARIISDSTGSETAEAARIRFAGQNSVLGTIVGNVQSALLKCMDWALMFMGGDGENILEINMDFYDKTIDPQLIIAQIQLLDRGIIAKTDLRSEMREHGIIDKDRTDEDIDGESEVVDPIEPGGKPDAFNGNTD